MRIVMTLLLLVAGPAFATDYYVRTDGSDSNTGLSNTPGGAWASPSKCATLTGGHRCRIQPGTYYLTSTITQANSGSLKANDVATCTCTKGSTTISCTSDVSGSVVAGDWVRCDVAGSYFNWARVSSVATTTINLESAYLGDGGYLGESPGGPRALDVAAMVEIVGDGSPNSVRIARTQAKPAGVTWVRSATYPDVWSYLKSDAPAGTAWRDPKSFRQTTASWDRWHRNYDGEDSWIHVRVGSCPCASQTTCEAHVSKLAGSWCDDGTRVWGHAYRNADISTAGVVASNAGYYASSWNSNKDYIVFRNLWFDTAGDNPGYGTTDTAYGFIIGGSNMMLKDITSQGGTCRFDLSSSRTRMEVRGVDCLEKANATSANVTHSGLRFYDFEVRGGLSNSFLIDYLQGASSTDLIMFDRFYLHRTHSGVMGTDCGQLAVYDCPTESYVGNREFDGAHGSDIGNPTVNQYVNNVITQNSIVEITGDGFGIFGPGKNVIYRNCTLGYSNSYNANTRQESIRFGVSGQPSGIASYNNVFYVDAVTGSNYNGSYWSYGTTWANYAGDNNLYLHPFNSSANMATTSVTFNGMGSLADVSLPAMISTYGQETNSIVVCYSGCSDSVVHYYNDGDNSRNYFTKPHTSDGTVSDYTPTSVNRGRDSGRNDQCPSEDFYGRPRNDGRCDIGAVEYQGNPPDTTPPSPITNLSATPGPLQITLAWNHSASSDSKGTLVRARTTGYPTGPTDGALVCDKVGLPGASDSCVHGGLVAGTTYYYTAYSYDAASNYGTGVQASAAPNSTNTAPQNVQNLHRTDKK